MKQWNKYKEEIENFKDSFTVGRRNDDLVNWTIAFMVTEKADYGAIITDELCIDVFEQLMLGFRDEQIDALVAYDYKDKIRTVVTYYSEEDPETLESLLIDVEYN